MQQESLCVNSYGRPNEREQSQVNVGHHSAWSPAKPLQQNFTKKQLQWHLRRKGGGSGSLEPISKICGEMCGPVLSPMQYQQGILLPF